MCFMAICKNDENCPKIIQIPLFSSPGRSPGRAIVLPSASASGLALALALVAASALAKC